MPALLDQPGAGPVSAAQLLVTWSHPGRFRTEAAFAALTGTSPIPASSGRTTRHRINPYGDRNANRALHTIAISRLRYTSPPSPTPPAAPPKATPPARSAAASSATWPATSTGSWNIGQRLTNHRSVMTWNLTAREPGLTWLFE
jgi:transposase